MNDPREEIRTQFSLPAKRVYSNNVSRSLGVDGGGRLPKRAEVAKQPGRRKRDISLSVMTA